MDDLGILSAQFYDGAYIGMEMLHGEDHGIDLLYKTGIEGRSDTACTGTGDIYLVYLFVGLFVRTGECFKKFEQGGGLFGVMGGIGFGNDSEVRVAENILDGGGADVYAKGVCFFYCLIHASSCRVGSPTTVWILFLCFYLFLMVGEPTLHGFSSASNCPDNPDNTNQNKRQT